MIDATLLVDQTPLQKLSIAAAVPTSEPISLEQAKQHLRVVGPDDDAYISALIVAARQMAEGRTNRTILRRVLEATFDSWRGEMVLLRPPFVAIDSISYIDSAGEEQLLDPAAYFVGTGTGLAVVEFADHSTLPALQRRRSPINVRYVAGYAEGEVPQPLIQWMLLVIGTLYENRETVSAGVAMYEMPDNFMHWLIQPYRVYE
jgi:uncharacterized phiE125 gp8 family phage protein